MRESKDGLELRGPTGTDVCLSVSSLEDVGDLWQLLLPLSVTQVPGPWPGGAGALHKQGRLAGANNTCWLPWDLLSIQTSDHKNSCCPTFCLPNLTWNHTKEGILGNLASLQLSWHLTKSPHRVSIFRSAFETLYRVMQESGTQK